MMMGWSVLSNPTQLEVPSWRTLNKDIRSLLCGVGGTKDVEARHYLGVLLLRSNPILYIYFNCMYECVCMYVSVCGYMYMSAGTHGAQQRASGHPGAEFTGDYKPPPPRDVRHRTCVL